MLEPVRKMKPGYVLRPPNTDERLSNRERELLQTALRMYHNDLADHGMDTDAEIAARLSLRLADPSKELVLVEGS